MHAPLRRRVTLSLALIATLGCGAASVAQADFAADSPIGSARLTTALALATQHWGTPPCGGQQSIAWSVQAPDVNAVSQWSNPMDSYLRPALNADCSIALNPAAEWDWPKLCTVVVHEVGHLDGQQHSADPSDVMSPFYHQPVSECVETPDPQAIPAPAPTAAVVAVAKPRASAPARSMRPTVRPKHRTARKAKRTTKKAAHTGAARRFRSVAQLTRVIDGGE